jgi:hypothetical protein
MFNDIKATNKRIAKQIKSIAGRNKTLRNMIQSTLCEIAAHAYQHGDVTHYNTLLDAIRGQDRKAIIDWIEEYGFARIRPDGTFGKAKAAVDAADYADAQAVFDDYTAPDTTIKPWFDFVKSVQQIAKDMTMPQLLNALMAKAAEHADPDSDLEAKGKVRNKVVWGDAHEWEHALANAAHIAQQIQGRINANVPPMAIAAE